MTFMDGLQLLTLAWLLKLHLELRDEIAQRRADDKLKPSA